LSNLHGKSSSKGQVEEQDKLIAYRLNDEEASSYVLPPEAVRELLFLVLDHIYWLAVQPLGSTVDFERDVAVMSIWLGQEFSGPVLRPNLSR